MKIGRNAPCPCGSGKKYKKCCLNKEKPPLDLLWRRLGDAHDRLVDNLMAFARNTFGESALAVAMDEFLLWPEEDVPEDLTPDHAHLFVPWFVFNWVYDPEDTEIDLPGPPLQTVAQAYSKEQGARLDGLERRLIEATSNQPYSFFEVINCEPGQGFRLRDVLQGMEADVIEKQGSKNVRPGDILFGRIIQVDHVVMLVGCGSILIPPNRKPAIIELRRDMLHVNRQITPEVLNDYDFEIRELYLDIYESFTLPPQICNTDGEPLLLHTLHYEIDDPETTFRRLCGLSVVKDEKTLRRSATLDNQGRVVKAAIQWTRKGHKASRALDNTILGSIVINNRKLSVDVNSEARAEAIRKEIESRLGNHAVYKTTQIQAPEAMLAEEKNGKGEGLEKGMGHDDLIQIPEVREQLAKVMTTHWEDWVDEGIPALGGKTPRQAVKTLDGRESVEALLLDAERHMAGDQQMGDIGLTAIKDVRRRLGLDKAPAAKVKKSGNKKNAERNEAIKNMIRDFGGAKLNTMYTDFALKLCDKIARMRKLSIQRGRVEIWAAAIVHVIARLNFLFDPENEVSITTDEMCAFFNTKKTTVSSKAGLIQNACNLYLGNAEFSAPEVANMFRLYETKEGLLVPAFMRNDLEGMHRTGYDSQSDETATKAEKSKRRQGCARGESKRHDTDEKDRDPQLKLFDDA
jgi:hypothetical protein